MSRVLFSYVRPFMCALGALLASACTDPVVVAPSQLVVELRSDLVASGQLAYVRVDTLDSTGDQVVQSRWLVVHGSCGEPGDALHSLGSFGVERGSRDVARLRIVAFGPDRGEGIKPLVDQRVDAVFQHGPLALTVDLTQACFEKSCADVTQTCEPTSGRCAAIPRVEKASQPSQAEASCLMPEEAPPVLWVEPEHEPDGGTIPPRDPCDSTDGMCGIGCTPVTDLDCGKVMGVMCGAAGECRRGLSCVESFCCESECDDPCDTCSAEGSAGSCVKRDFSKSADVNHCGGCDVQCGSANASVAQCNEGKCTYACNEGWKDCSAGTDGCETDVRADPMHCGGCGEEFVCKYPFCIGGKCAQQIGGVAGLGNEELEAGTLVGTALSFGPGTVVGFGANLSALDTPRGKVRFALYYAGASGEVSELVAQSEPVTVTDFAQAVPDSAVSTNVAIPAQTIQPGFYWLFLLTEKRVQITTDSVTEIRFGQGGSSFEAFANPIAAPLGEYDDTRRALDLVVYLAPISQE